MSTSFTVWHHIKDKGSLSPGESSVETGIHPQARAMKIVLRLERTQNTHRSRGCWLWRDASPLSWERTRRERAEGTTSQLDFVTKSVNYDVKIPLSGCSHCFFFFFLGDKPDLSTAKVKKKSTNYFLKSLHSEATGKFWLPHVWPNTGP